MRKITSLLLTIAFVLSTLAFAAIGTAAEVSSVGTVADDYAPEGTGITAIAEATDPQGTYYLKNDITVDTTIATEFTGTLDGNGKTITVSAPIFEVFSGTLKNVTIAGAVDRSGEEKVHTGAVANNVPVGKAATFVNVKNTATVKGATKDWAGYGDNSEYGVRAGAGSFVGLSEGSIFIDGCQNDADIFGYAVGGFVGYVEAKLSADTTEVVIKNSVNNGKISAKGLSTIYEFHIENGKETTVIDVSGSNAAVGGLLGLSNNVKKMTLENLQNNGEVYGESAVNSKGFIKGKSAPAGGIVGYAFTEVKKSDDGLFTMKNLVNNAKITGSNQVGGISCWFIGNVVAENLVNNGDVESTENYAGGIFGRTGSNGIGTKVEEWGKAVLKNCVNNGNVKSAESQTGGLVGYTNAPVEFYNCVNTVSLAPVTGKAGGILGSGGTGTIAKFYGCFNSGNMTSVDDRAGGISASVNGTKIAALAASNGGYIVDARYCVNTGNIGGGKATGGIIGGAGVSGAYGFENVSYCINTGNVSGLDGAGSSSLAASAVGGIMGYAYASGKNEYPKIENNVTIGDVSNADAADGVSCYFLGYTSSANAVIEYNKASGTLTSASRLTYSIAWNNHSTGSASKAVGNCVPEGTTYAVIHTGTRDAGKDESPELGVFDAATALTGELVFSMNEAIKADETLNVTEDVFFQRIGATFAPTPIPEVKVDAYGENVVVNAVVKSESDVFGNPEYVAPLPVGPDVPSGDPVAPATGDATGVMFVLLAVSALACFGLALVPSKKHN